MTLYDPFADLVASMAEMPTDDHMDNRDWERGYHAFYEQVAP